MKVTLLLLASLIGISCQQKVFWPLPYAQKIHLMPFIVDEANAQGYVSLDTQDDQSSSEDEIRDLYASFYAQSLGRNKVESKLLQNGFFTNFLATTLTSTVWSEIPSTLTTIVVSSCIPVGQFSVNAGVTSTNVCARKKRSAADKFLIKTPISATPAQIVDVTADVPRALEVELKSSREDPPGNPSSIQRRNRALTVLKTVTSTMTSYSFTSTVILKTVSLAAGAQLLCRPPGYGVC